MNNELTEEQIERVGDYIMGLLSKEERMAFEQQLIVNPVLQAEVNLQKEVILLVEEAEDMRLKEMLKEVDLEAEDKAEDSTGGRKWWLVAILVLILLGIAWLVWKGQEESPERLYAAYFEPYQNVLVPTVRDAGVPLDVLEAFQAYEDGNYETALLAFNQLPVEVQKPDYELYEALSLMQTNRVGEAIRLLQVLKNNSDSQFREHAQWYLALAYLKQGNTPKARQFLEGLVENKSAIFEKKARELLSKL